MRKWGEIKQATLDKLFLTIDEAESQDYVAKFRYLANECLNIIANGVKPKIRTYSFLVVDKIPEDVADGIDVYLKNEAVKMPEDFISFADMLNYVDGKPHQKLRYYGDKSLIATTLGLNEIFYNGEYDEITEEIASDDNSKLDVDSSVLNCVPTYIASQLLSQDDIQRSSILKNEFELMLSRLDTNIMYEVQHFEEGWC